MKKKEEYIIFGTIILLVVIVLIYSLNKDVQKTTYKIEYHCHNKIYDIKVLNNSINIDVKDQIQCIKAPCDPITIDSYSLPNNDKYKDYFARKFKFEQVEEMIVNCQDIDKADKVIFDELIDYNKGNENNNSYTIDEINDRSYNKRGYYIERGYNQTKIIIAMGKKNTGGYSIDVEDVKVSNDEVFIIVREVSPKATDTVTAALTYPSVVVTLPNVINYVNVKNTNGYLFKLIKK